MADTADLAKLKIGDFSPHLNTGFEIHMADGKVVPVTLAEAASSGTAPPKGLKGPNGEDLKVREGGGFTLNFVAPESSRLKQGIYPVSHPKLGTLEIFLVPSGPVPQGYGYHAVFG